MMRHSKTTVGLWKVSERREKRQTQIPRSPTRPAYDARWKTGPEPVGQSEPNAFGLFDQNVHEWCSDWYGPDYYVIFPDRNPQGPEDGKRRASRGGSWRHQIRIARCSARSSIPPEFKYADYGFRVVCDGACQKRL
jgi:formylglycine-generating enzyme required for sulfatase activity